MTTEKLTLTEHLERAENLAMTLMLATLNDQPALTTQGIAFNLLKNIQAARQLLKEQQAG